MKYFQKVKKKIIKFKMGKEQNTLEKNNWGCICCMISKCFTFNLRKYHGRNKSVYAYYYTLLQKPSKK